MDLETYIKLESLKTANVDGVTKYLYNDDINLVKYALSGDFSLRLFGK